MNLSDFCRLRIGDTVKVVDKWVIDANTPRRFNSSGHMDKWLGKTLTVSAVLLSHVQCAEDGGKWAWYPELLDGLVVPPEFPEPEADDLLPLSELILQTA